MKHYYKCRTTFIPGHAILLWANTPVNAFKLAVKSMFGVLQPKLHKVAQQTYSIKYTFMMNHEPVTVTVTETKPPARRIPTAMELIQLIGAFEHASGNARVIAGNYEMLKREQTNDRMLDAINLLYKEIKRLRKAVKECEQKKNG